MSSTQILVSHAKVITPARVIEDGALLVEAGLIAAVGRSADLRHFEGRVSSVIDAGGRILTPGFIDIHVHGANGGDVMAATCEALETMASFHATGGTTALVATTLTAPQKAIEQVLSAVRRVRLSPPTHGAAVLGAHIEGPYIAREQAGAQNPAFVRPAAVGEVDRLLERADEIRIITAAPEVEGVLELARRAAARGIVPSIGHSSAYYPDVVRAVESGFRSVTHLFCGMPPWINVKGDKTAGIVESAFLIDELTTEVIGDGNHVSPHLMQLTFHVKGADRVCLITDAMWATGLPSGPYKMGGLDIVVTETAARMADGSGNAGSVATMDRNVQNAVFAAGIPLHDAVRAATRTPAALLGIDHKKGTLAPGKDADIALLDTELKTALTMVEGRIVYDRDNLAQPRGTGNSGISADV